MSTRFSYYPGNIYDSIAAGNLTAEQLHYSITNPKPKIKSLIDEVALAGRKKDHELKQELKTKLFYVTPAVYIEVGAKRRYSNIKYFTGYMQLDFDKLDSIQEAIEFRDWIFTQYECIVMSFLSPSKLGVKCLLKIPRCNNVDEFKDYHKAVEDEMSNYKGFDHATINCVLPMFISYDYDAKYRDHPVTWEVKGSREVDYVYLNSVESEYGRSMEDWQKVLKTVEFFKAKIEEIVDGDGHPRFRSACLVLGSRAGAGYIDSQQAIELVEWAVTSNTYLAKKRATYLKTGMWAIQEGMQHPQYY